MRLQRGPGAERPRRGVDRPTHQRPRSELAQQRWDDHYRGYNNFRLLARTTTFGSGCGPE
eukprot:8170120-Heterocapsa_arctica.AAC.1